MSDNLILVDINDNEIGIADKTSAHEQPLLHRAFSVFLYKDISEKRYILLQKRAQNKYHSAGLWANSCCSHPREKEDLFVAAKRRLEEELAVTDISLLEIDSFIYFHQFHNKLYEYEFDHVLVGRYNGTIRMNPQEVAETAWVEVDKVAEGLLKNPKDYAPWFFVAAPKVVHWLVNNG